MKPPNLLTRSLKLLIILACNCFESHSCNLPKSAPKAKFKVGNVFEHLPILSIFVWIPYLHKELIEPDSDSGRQRRGRRGLGGGGQGRGRHVVQRERRVRRRRRRRRLQKANASLNLAPFFSEVPGNALLPHRRLLLLLLLPALLGLAGVRNCRGLRAKERKT